MPKKRLARLENFSTLLPLRLRERLPSLPPMNQHPPWRLYRPVGIVKPMARQRILDAAACLAEEDGAHSLSLERVAERAGVSKGGLLYHFRSKEELLNAMLLSVIDAHDRDIQDRVEAGESYVEVMIDHCMKKNERPGCLMSAFIAAVAVDKNAQAIIRERRKQWMASLEAAGIPKTQALILGLAFDGLFVGSSLGVTEFTACERDAIREGLMDLTQPSEEGRLADWFNQALARVEA